MEQIKIKSDDQARQVLLKVLGDKGSRLYDIGADIDNEKKRLDWYSGIIYGLLTGQRGAFDHLSAFKQTPVPIRKFIDDPFYLNAKDTVYPVVMEELEAMVAGDYIEIVLTGGIGSGKTTCAHYLIAYHLYILSCMKDPHRFFDLDPSHEILFVFQSLSASHAKQLEYNRFRTLLERSHYFTEVYPFDKDLLSRIVFPNRIEVVALSGQETAAIGQNVMGGVLDEVNYMAVIESSKSSVDGGGYDQAWALYNSIARRRKSRFTKAGTVYGMLCLVSSKRFPGQFTDVKEQQSREQMATKGKSDIYIYDKRVWEISPKNTYSGEEFLLFEGDEFRQPRLLDSYDELSEVDHHLIRPIPIEYQDDFKRDILNSLREVAGVSTLASHPYIVDTDSVTTAMTKGKKNVFSRNDVDFVNTQLKLMPGALKDKDEPRWAHIDLSVTGDHTGLVIGYIKDFVQIDRGDSFELWPNIVIDGVLEIVPPAGSEIEYHKIRSVLYKLKDVLGLNIKWVTFDSFQSVDSIQVLRQAGFVTGNRSVDIDIRPYAMLKAALSDRRISIPDHPKLRKELLSVEYDSKKGKVDHPSHSSKDVSDSLAAVVHGLTTRMELWSRHKVTPTNVPLSVRETGAKQNKKEQQNENANGGIPAL